MIKLYSLKTKEEIAFEITKFPDGTSQVWKLARIPDGDEELKVVWQFENEAELSHVIQLGYLITTYPRPCKPILYTPFLPYGRQDKEVSNETTFASRPIFDCLYDKFYVVGFDNHSNKNYGVRSISPENFFKSVVYNPVHLTPRYEVICFPDKGARDRYEKIFNLDADVATYGHRPFKIVHLDKVRNQLTGEIEGLAFAGAPANLTEKDVLIVDDLVDGGRTFIEAAKVLKAAGAHAVDLCVSHGIFSKGTNVILEAGIREIFTTNSLKQNPKGYDVLGLDL